MVSLTNLAEKGLIEKTGAKPKLPIKIDGISSSTLDVYRIPLNYLYYNDNNGRIATGTMSYEGKLIPSTDDVDPAYNNTIEKMIEEDAPAALKRTQKSILDSGQQVYGWVLDDGRIIDGNRRYTALRNIHYNTGKTMYFEAVVLPFSYDNVAERVKIKQLELAIQMGVEERKDYDPVDLAVDIYKTTTATENSAALMTKADYAQNAHMRKKEVDRIYDGAVCMKKFLEYIGAPATAYNIVKDSKAWSLFYEMGKTLHKFGDDAEGQLHKRETMESYFAVILYQTHVGVIGNTARTHIRNYGKYIVSSPKNNDFNEDLMDSVDDLSESLQDANIVDYTDLTRELSKENGIIEDVANTYNRYMNDARNGESVEKFIRTTRDNVEIFEDLKENNGLLGSLRYNQITNVQLKQLQMYMRNLHQISQDLFDMYGDEIDAKNNQK